MSMYDKNISDEKRKSLEFAEESRESEWKYPSFALKLFHGVLDWDLIYPFPEQSEEEKQTGDTYLKKLEDLLKERLDPNAVDRTGEIPQDVIDGLGELGAFAIKIPKEYGGLGLSQTNYSRAMHMVSSYCGSTAVLLSAHQSIGVPQPLKLFGTEEQKKKYFPQFAKGVISAFALTEPEAGSDPRQMTTTATPVENGDYYLINGEKLWCTNGLIAGVIVVMAVTPPKIINGKERKQITAFIVETDSPGFEVVHRCHFMGLHGIQNGLIRFNNLKVPKENIILGLGHGLKLALTTLNTGRLTIPSASTGISKWCLKVAREWSATRKQWGSPIGEHEAVGLKLGYIASHTFAMDAVSWLSAHMADDKNKDIRIEAAMAKHFCTWHSWYIVNETLQIRGGQGYEQAESLKARGMDGLPIERVVRDVRINLIIEGTTEIMHLFIAREALDPHLTRARALLSSRTSAGTKLKALLKASLYYMMWYPLLWLPSLPKKGANSLPKPLNKHIRYVQKTSKRLARVIFHNMMLHQTRLESKQTILRRVVDIGTDLFVMSAACSYAGKLFKDGKERRNSVELADLFCQDARKRIEENFNGNNTDKEKVKISKKILARDFEWLEYDIIK